MALNVLGKSLNFDCLSDMYKPCLEKLTFFRPTGSVKIGFHRNRHKPQRSSNRKFEAAIQRRKRTSHSGTKNKEKKSTSKKNNNQNSKRASREGCSSSIGQWLISCSQAASSTRSRNTQSQDVSRQLRSRIMNSFR